MSPVEKSLEYWEAIRGDRPVPRRSDFDPSDIPRLLTHVVFLDVIDGGADFRFRVIGDAVRSISHANYTGQLVGSLPHINQDGPLLTSLRAAVSSREPVRSQVPYMGPVKEISLRDHMILPFSGEDGEVSHLLITIDLIDSRH